MSGKKPLYFLAAMVLFALATVPIQWVMTSTRQRANGLNSKEATISSTQVVNPRYLSPYKPADIQTDYGNITRFRAAGPDGDIKVHPTLILITARKDLLLYIKRTRRIKSFSLMVYQRN